MGVPGGVRGRDRKVKARPAGNVLGEPLYCFGVISGRPMGGLQWDGAWIAREFERCSTAKPNV
jgi:hypothetical protein